MSLRLLPRQAAQYLENPTAGDFARAARWALQSEDLEQATEQVSAALALAPEDPSHRHLLDEILGCSKQPEALVALSPEGVFYGLLAARAHWLASHRGDVNGALQALFEVAAFRPATPFLRWGVEWTSNARGRRGVLPATAAQGLVRLTESVRANARLPADETQRSAPPQPPGWSNNLEAASLIAERIQFKHPAHDELRVARSRALRLLNRPVDAERCVQSGSHGSWAVLIERAAIAGALGDRQARVKWLRRAAALKPASPETHCDLADALLHEGRLEEAVVAYGTALALENCPSQAAENELYARALLERRTLLPSDFPPVAPTATVLSFCRDLHAYRTRLPDPIDPLIAVVRGATSHAARATSASPFTVRVKTERPACSSLRLALRFSIGRTGKVVQFETVCSTPSDGAALEPTPPSPASHRDSPPRSDVASLPGSDENASAAESVRRLARAPFHWETWCKEAADDGPARPSHVWLSAGLDPPDDAAREAVQWVHAYHVAAALLAAYGNDSIDERLHTLARALRDPEDWTSAAAALGLRALAERDPDSRERVVRLLASHVPADNVSLTPAALAIAVSGDTLARGDERQVFSKLRARVRHELHQR